MTLHNGHIQPDSDGSAAFADGVMSAPSGEDDGVFVTEISARFGLPEATCLELYGEIEEHILASLPDAEASPSRQSGIALLFRRGACHCADARTPQRQAYLFQCLM